jgi:hypothetical protein
VAGTEAAAPLCPRSGGSRQGGEADSRSEAAAGAVRPRCNGQRPASSCGSSIAPARFISILRRVAISCPASTRRRRRRCAHAPCRKPTS